MKNFQYYARKLIGTQFKILESPENLADGEIRKFNFVESQKLNNRIGTEVSYQFSCEGDSQMFDGIWVQCGNDYYKCIGKWKVSQWSCQ